MKAKKIISLCIIIGLALGYVAAINRNYIAGFASGINNFVFQCSDFGKNFTQTQNYLKNGVMLDDVVENSQEPGWYLIITNLIRIAGFSSIQIPMVIFSLFVFIIIGLISALFVRKTTGKWFYGVLAFAFILFSFVQNMSYFGHVRQILCNFLLYVTIYGITFWKIDRKIGVILGCLLGMMIMSQRAVMGLGIISLFLVGLFDVIFIKKNKIIHYFEIGFFCLLFTIPFLYFSIEDFSRTASYLLSVSVEDKNQSGVFNTQVNVVGGFSIVTYGYSTAIPFFTLLFPFPALILAGCAGILQINKKNISFIIVLIFFTVYCLKTRNFSHRIIETLEPLWVIAGCTFLPKLGRLSKPLLVALITVVFVSSTVYKSPQLWKGHYLISKNEPSVNYSLQNIPLSNTIIFGSQCILDLFQQLGYTTAYTPFIYTVAHINELEEKGIFMSGPETWTFAEEYWRFLGRKTLLPMPEFFRGKNVYLLFSHKYWNKDQIMHFDENKNQIENITNLMEFPNNYLLNRTIKLQEPFEYFTSQNYYKSFLNQLGK